MSADLWPCWRCGGPGVRNLGTSGFCGQHLAELLDTFHPEAFQRHGVPANGIGLQGGEARPDLGADYVELVCAGPDCGRTWVGRIGERCPSCCSRRWSDTDTELQLAHHATRVSLMAPPDSSVDDQEWVEWGRRLSRAAAQGIISHAEARAAWRRGVIRASA